MKLQHGMIVSPEPEAVEVGADILRAGGNAVDAAIACAFAQGVVDPMMCGIAGFGSMGIFTSSSKELEYIDFHAPAPRAAKEDMWADLIEGEARDGYGFILKGRVNDIGYQSICVPASLRAYETAHKRHGRLPWAELLKPAIEWAKRGWAVKPHNVAFWCEPEEMGRVANYERLAYTEAGRAIYCRDGSPKLVGDHVTNGDLAGVLELIAKEGADCFYVGSIADRIVEDMIEHGALLGRADLEEYRPLIRKPVLGTYRGYTVNTNQPPGGGITLLQMLNMLEHFDLTALKHNSPEYIRIVSEVMKRATIDKDRFIGDPDFIEVPQYLVSKQYSEKQAAQILNGERAHVERFNGGFPSKDTTHLSVMDTDGNCVTMTHSLGMPSGVITSGLGFMYNGCMGVFDPRPGNVGSIAPGKSRYSSVCPSIIFKNGDPYLVIGAPGATQIAMGVLQVILNILDFGMNAGEAVAAPRFSSTSNAIDVTNRIPYATTRALEAQGYDIIRSPLSFSIASVHCIRNVDGHLDGGADPYAGGMPMLV